jgi:hypothetical protein
VAEAVPFSPFRRHLRRGFAFPFPPKRKPKPPSYIKKKKEKEKKTEAPLTLPLPPASESPGRERGSHFIAPDQSPAPSSAQFQSRFGDFFFLFFF